MDQEDRNSIFIDAILVWIILLTLVLAIWFYKDSNRSMKQQAEMDANKKAIEEVMEAQRELNMIAIEWRKMRGDKD